MKKILVMTDHMPWGHRSIARAIFDYLRDFEKKEDWKVEMVQVQTQTGVAGELNNLFYRYLPQAQMVMHKASQVKGVADIATQEAVEANLEITEKTIKKYKPDVVICSYFVLSHCLAKLKESGKYNFKLWTVVADPWTPHGLSWVKGAEVHLVYDERAAKMAVEAGIDRKGVMVTGWWTRPVMYERLDKILARRKLGMEGDYPILFVGGGSLGSVTLTKILPVLPFVKKEMGIVFNCGTDRVTQRLVGYYDKLLSSIWGSKKLVHIKVLGWIDNMAEVLSGCDMVLGKAGPNFLFDVVAAAKPFVAITHIYGQECGNLEIIRKKKLGWVKEETLDLSRFLLDYLKDPKSFEKKYEKSILAERERNRGSLTKIKNALSREELQ